MSETQTLVAILSVVMFVASYTYGYYSGQLKAMKEHLKFLEESSARQDEISRNFAEVIELRKAEVTPIPRVKAKA